jgi:hypothetical protein
VVNGTEADGAVVAITVSSHVEYAGDSVGRDPPRRQTRKTKQELVAGLAEPSTFTGGQGVRGSKT